MVKTFACFLRDLLILYRCVYFMICFFSVEKRCNFVTGKGCAQSSSVVLFNDVGGVRAFCLKIVSSQIRYFSDSVSIPVNLFIQNT